MMPDVIFAGKSHKITTDGKTFFLYVKSDSKWELKDSNSFGKGIYKEALNDIKALLKSSLAEEEKILKICESGFFSISNL
jgi:hypothetical protein